MAQVDYVPFVNIDINSASSATMPGYNAMNFKSDNLTTTFNVSPDITVTTSRQTVNNNANRNVSEGDALTRDFIFEDASNTVTTTVTGLVVGKQYSLKVFSHDINNNTSASSTWSIKEGDNAPVDIGSIANAQTAHNSTDANTYLAYTFTAQADTIVLTDSAIDNPVIFNGLSLTEEYKSSDGLTRFDITSADTAWSPVTRVIAPRATELYIPSGSTGSYNTTALSGIKMTVSTEGTYQTRNRAQTSPLVDNNMFTDVMYTNNAVPFTTTLENLKTDTIYRLTVYSIDPLTDQSAGVWTMKDGNDNTLFTYTHNPTYNNAATWSFDQYIKTGTSTVTMEAVKGSKAYMMLNGLQLQEITYDTSDYYWSAGRANWLDANKWYKLDGVTTGIPEAGDLCYAQGNGDRNNQAYWLVTTTTAFPGTLVISNSANLLFKGNATVNDLILDGGILHHGDNKRSYSLNGNLFVASNSIIDIDDGSWRTLTINSVLSGPGNLNIEGVLDSETQLPISTVIFTNASPNYSGKINISKSTVTLQGDGVDMNCPITVDSDGILEYNVDKGKTKKLSISDINKIVSTGEVIKTGEGTLQLYEASSGAIDILSLTVSSGRVDLLGYMSGGIKVEPDSVFSPGNSVGDAWFGGGYELKEDAMLLIEQDASGIDTLTATSFDINPNSILELTLESVEPGRSYDIIFQTDSEGNPKDFTSVNHTGYTNDYSDAAFWNSLLTPESAYYWSLSVNGNVVTATMNANAVPEPSTWALLALGVVVLFLRKRVRN